MILHALTTTAMDMAAAFPGQIPNPDPIAPPGSEKFVTIMGWLKWVALALAVVAIIVAGVMMGFNSRRGEGSEHAGRLGMIFGGVILISSATAIIGFIAA